jgi:hypothetical protein
MTPVEAGDGILALVCGFPGKRAYKRLLMVLNAYIDASGKGDPFFLVMAGYIATAEAWIEFSKEWKAQLDEAGLPYFKMNEMASRPEIAGYFYRVVERHDIKAAVSCVVHTDELVKVEKEFPFPKHFFNTEKMTNPYYFAFKVIIDVLAQQNVNLGLNEPVDFIFDEDSEKKEVLEAWQLLKENSEPKVAVFMGDTPIYRNDKTTMPLQAADLFAWWALKWEREGRQDWARDLPFPWGMKRNIRRLAMRFRERSFRIEKAKALVKVARNVGELMYALSIFPDEDEFKPKPFGPI